MSKRLSSWCGRHLSYGGRITLINSVLASLPLYFFSFFKAPVCVLKQLVRIQRNFLWGGGLEDKKLCWVKWEQICMPRDQGGLGVKNLELFNLALLSKWKWRCVNESDAVWTDVLRFRYGHLPSKFLNEELYSCGAKDSIWWRDLVNVGDSFLPGWFKSNVSCIVGNGKNINFWKNKWFGNNSFSELFPTLFSKDACSEAMIADRLNNSTDEITWSWDWRVPLSLQEEQELFSLKELLRGFSLKPDCCDKWRWMSESDGLFTVKSCYKMLLQDDNCDAISAESLVAIRKLWKNDLPSKVGVFGWRLLLEKLPTRVALAHRGIILSGGDLKCVLCSSMLEDLSHLFFNCIHVSNIWKKIYAWLGLPYNNQGIGHIHFMQFGAAVKAQKGMKFRHLIWLATTWCIWRMRNNIIFRGEGADFQRLFDHIRNISWYWFSGRVGRLDKSTFFDWCNNPLKCLSSF
ncbi:unnamed protein product [Trifolium pratense]|uniref:Uncharacterized protein n=1 Tax=Trifolium pratense TaxID=57577 RepID=A0ACB0JLZ2_TRIPR|nr:unnamed protein product [Trifolium pratense]